MTDQSDTESAGLFSGRTNQTREARADSHDGPIRRRKNANLLRNASPMGDMASTQCSIALTRETKKL
eukprot:1183912-Prorocentrum_minimum.AAC.2